MRESPPRKKHFHLENTRQGRKVPGFRLLPLAPIDPGPTLHPAIHKASTKPLEISIPNYKNNLQIICIELYEM
jgi:hypothetical protein